jgi:hypothetical protein
MREFPLNAPFSELMERDGEEAGRIGFAKAGGFDVMYG